MTFGVGGGEVYICWDFSQIQIKLQSFKYLIV